MKTKSKIERCNLSGNELDAKVSELEGTDVLPYSTDWAIGGPIIERDLIYLDPPSLVHYNPGGYVDHKLWSATVSSKTRERVNQNMSQDDALVKLCPHTLNTVGRGEGETALIAAMRAYVDSFTKE